MFGVYGIQIAYFAISGGPAWLQEGSICLRYHGFTSSLCSYFSAIWLLLKVFNCHFIFQCLPYMGKEDNSSEEWVYVMLRYIYRMQQSHNISYRKLVISQARGTLVLFLKP